MGRIEIWRKLGRANVSVLFFIFSCVQWAGKGGYFCPTYPTQTLILVLTSESCSLARECPQFPYQAHSKPRISPLSGSTPSSLTDLHPIPALASKCCGLAQLAHTHFGSHMRQWVRQPSPSWPVFRPSPHTG